ncbi:MAG: DEAD/DEAH box helicase, partial [Pseudomonadota bacterium]
MAKAGTPKDGKARAPSAGRAKVVVPREGAKTDTRKLAGQQTAKPKSTKPKSTKTKPTKSKSAKPTLSEPRAGEGQRARKRRASAKPRAEPAAFEEAVRSDAHQTIARIGTELPPAFATWFADRGWALRAHQQAMIEAYAARRSTLLVAPTGAGKTLSGFLPSLIDLHLARAGRLAAHASVHTLYISPLKALAVDVARNVTTPAEEMDLKLRIETRTGDTPASRRQRQLRTPPDILMTTPEQLALLLSHPSAEVFFADLKLVVLDELHALVTSKRGDLLALDLARLRTLAPEVTSFGLSATVARPTELQAYLAHQVAPDDHIALADRVIVREQTVPEIRILDSEERLPWSGHMARYAFPEILEEIKSHQLSLIFVNTRSQAELIFRGLWEINEESLPIALHHGSLDVGQRRKVEAAMVAGTLKAVVCTSTLDLGIDWGDVDLVINVGAPKGASRLLQRIGRANHRLNEPSRALLVPANRFEVMECRAALDAAQAGAQDTQIMRSGALDVLAQHLTGMACAGPFGPGALFDEVRSALPYSGLTRAKFDRVIDFVST